MNRVAEITGLKLQYITGPSWAEFLEMMRNDELDVMLNIVDLPERRSLFQFTTSYTKSLTGVFTTTKGSGQYFSMKDLAGKTVAVPKGFDTEINLPKYHPDIRLLPVKDILACIDAVHSGAADAFVEEIGVGDYIMSQRMVPDLRFAFQINEKEFTSDLRVATIHDKSLLFSIIQKGLNAITADELHQIRKKWLLQAYEVYEKSMVNLTSKERAYLYDNPDVKICVDPSWAPLDFIDGNGLHSGLSADLINKIAARLGVTIHLVPTVTWEQSLNNIREGKCDIIPLMNEREEVKSFIDFTPAYFHFPTVIAARDDASFVGDYSELYGKKVVLLSYFFITDYVREHHPQIEVIEVSNTSDALKMVSEQKAFATIDGLPNIVTTIESLALKNVKIVGSVPQENRMRLGVRKGNDLLFSIFSKGVSSLSEQEKMGLYKKWFSVEMPHGFLDYRLFYKFAAVFVVIVGFLAWRQLLLSKYTKKLQRLNKKLRYFSTMDHLTKIYNRHSIEKHLAIEIKRAALTRAPLAVVLFDIDHFKKVNDIYGHLAGDAVLTKMAALVKSSIRDTDRLGRWGGEEFLIVLPATSHENGEKVAANLRAKIAGFDFELAMSVTASFGVGQFRDGDSSTSLLSRIDRGLYAAKNRGRNVVIDTEGRKEGRAGADAL